mgnify:CR=1 FL=1
MTAVVVKQRPHRNGGRVVFLFGRDYYRFEAREDPCEALPPVNERLLPSKPGRALAPAPFLTLSPGFLPVRRAAKFSIRRFCFAACASCSALRRSFQLLALRSFDFSRRFKFCLRSVSYTHLTLPTILLV